MEDRQNYTIFWIVILGLLLLTRLPAMASYLSIDNVNLAFSLDRFDPRIHQPQPPGYPFFVGFARIVNLLFHDPERTFVVISLLVSALCLPVAFLLGRKIVSTWAGAAAAFLLLVNPVFWQAGLDGPLRPNLALFSLLTAYCCWRCWNGDKTFLILGAIALGIGSGFRPDLLAFLFPLWLVSAWAGTRSWRAVLSGIAVLVLVVGTWAAALVIAMGGIQTFVSTMLNYTVDQSRGESIVLGSSIGAWLRQINRLVIWNGLAVITWIWVLPFLTASGESRSKSARPFAFFFMWIVPGLIVQALVHIAAPGHTLFSVAAFCVLGGCLVSMARGREMILTAAVLMNVMLFLDYFPLPAAAETPHDAQPSVKNAFLFGTFETSVGQVRWLDGITETTLKEIEEFTPKDRPSVIITTDGYVNQWFMNWRIGRYYLPKREMWVVFTRDNKPVAERVNRDKIVEISSPKIPILPGSRILWLIEPDSEVLRKIRSSLKVEGGRYVLYTDVDSAFSPFDLSGIEIGS